MKYHFTLFKSPRSPQKEREQKREKETGDIKDIYMTFSNLNKLEMKPDNLSEEPRKI